MLIIASSFPTTQRLHSFKFTQVDRSHSQHSVDAVRCLGHHFLICTHAHMKSHSQTKDHEVRLVPVHRRNGQPPRRSFSPVALGKAYEHHIGKVLPTCSYTKNSLFTALVNCKARMVSCQYDSILCCSWPVVMITIS